jgi:hypothetical protein
VVFICTIQYLMCKQVCSNHAQDLKKMDIFKIVKNSGNLALFRFLGFRRGCLVNFKHFGAGITRSNKNCTFLEEKAHKQLKIWQSVGASCSVRGWFCFIHFLWSRRCRCRSTFIVQRVVFSLLFGIAPHTHPSLAQHTRRNKANSPPEREKVPSWLQVKTSGR